MLLGSGALVHRADLGRVDPAVEAAGAGALRVAVLRTLREVRVVRIGPERAAHARRLIRAGTGIPLGRVILGTWSTERTFELLVDNVAIDRTCTGSCGPAPEPTVEHPVEEDVPEIQQEDPATPVS